MRSTTRRGRPTGRRASSTSSRSVAATISAAPAGAPRQGHRRRQRARARGLSGNDLGSAARHVHDRVVGVGETSGASSAQPGARIACEPARSLCGERHSRDRGRRDSAVQVGDVRGARRRTPSGVCRGRDVARRALPRAARRRAGGRRSVLRRRREPHRLSRHGVLARSAIRGQAGSSTPASSSIRRMPGGTTSPR